MSNADDRCAYVDADGQCKYLRGNHWYVDGWHAFVEPAPQPPPSGEYGFCKFVDGEMRECDGYGNEPGWRERNQPAPSGDEAKAREIAKLFSQPGIGAFPSREERVLAAVRFAYAAGKADEALEKNGQWLGDMLLKIFADGWMGAQVAMRNAIERRGSEGK